MPVKRPVRSRLLALLAVAALAVGVGTTVTALAYPGIGPAVSFSVGCSSATPGQSCSVNACVTSSSGQPVAGEQVDFSSSDQSVGRISPSTAKTGGDGCVAGAQFKAGQQCGSVTLTAAISGASAQTQVDVQCGTGHGHGGNTAGGATGQVAGTQTGPRGGGDGTSGSADGSAPTAAGGARGIATSGGGRPTAALLAGVSAGGLLLAAAIVVLLRLRRRRPRGGAGGPEGPDEVVPGLFVGGAPRGARRRGLARLGVSRVVDLRSEAAVPTGWPSGVSVERVPLVDGAAPSPAELDSLVQRIEDWLEAGDKVLVHCTAGVGRAATVAVALLVRRGYSVGDAYRLLRERRPRVAPSDAQLAVLTRYARGLDGGATAPRPAA